MEAPADVTDEVSVGNVVVRCLNYMRFGPDNLFAVDRTGTELWRADASTATGSYNDAWTGVQLREGRLEAFTWSCFRVEIDPASGEILSRVFTK